MDNLNLMFPDDEVDCVMLASGEEDLEEAAIDADIQSIEDDDDDLTYDETIKGMTVTISMEGIEADEINTATKDLLSENGVEDAIDSAMMGIDPDVEEIEYDDDEEE